MSGIQTAHSVYNGYAPAEGPKAMPLEFDFSSESTYDIGLLTENTTGQFQFVQGVYVDNSRNPNELVILVKVTNQRLVVPANAQMTAPIFSIDQTQITVSTTPDTGVIVSLILLNVPTAYNSWGPINVTVANVTADLEGEYFDPLPTLSPGDKSPLALDSNGRLIVSGTISATSAPYQGIATDYSGVITTGGIAQTAIMANSDRRGLFISNPADQINVLQYNIAGGGWLDLLPGETYQSSALVPMGTIQVLAADTSHPYTAYELE